MATTWGWAREKGLLQCIDVDRAPWGGDVGQENSETAPRNAEPLVNINLE